MPWKSLSLAQVFSSSITGMSKISGQMVTIIGQISIIRAILYIFLNEALAKINEIQRLLQAFESSGFYAIVLSPSKGGWSSRMRIAPNAPPEGSSHYTCGVCVIAQAPDFNAMITSFSETMKKIQDRFTGYTPRRVNNRPPNVKIKAPITPPTTDVWQTKTLKDLFPAPFDTAYSCGESAIGFIADIKHALKTIDSVLGSAQTVLAEASSFMNDLSATGAYAVMLPTKVGGIMSRLEIEEGHPISSSSMYSIGFCVCFYAPNFDDCDLKFKDLQALFDSNMSYYPEFIEPYLPPIKSWAIPMSGYYDREVYVILNCNIETATIYYTVNGHDPRTDVTRLVFDITRPIYVDKNNTIIRYYAEDGRNVERRTRESIYHIIEYVMGVPYYPETGVGQGNSTIPPVGWTDVTWVDPYKKTTQVECCTGAGFEFETGFESELNYPIEYKIDGGSWISQNNQIIYSDNLPDGQHILTVRGLLYGGGYTPEISYSWTIDSTPLTVSFRETPVDNSTETSPVFEWEVNRLNCTHSYSLTAPGYSYSGIAPAPNIVFFGLSPNIYTFTLTVEDDLGNSAIKTYSWTIASTVPVLPPVVVMGKTIDVITEHIVPNVVVAIANRTITSNSSGDFSLLVEPGTHTITGTLDGYNICQQEIKVHENTPLTTNIFMSPIFDGWSCILRWGASPPSLDLRLYQDHEPPTHSSNVGSPTSYPYATASPSIYTGYGALITRIYRNPFTNKFMPNVAMLWVHNFSGFQGFGPAFSGNERAYIVSPTGVVHSYTIPRSGINGEILWHIANLVNDGTGSLSVQNVNLTYFGEGSGLPEYDPQVTW